MDALRCLRVIIGLAFDVLGNEAIESDVCKGGFYFLFKLAPDFVGLTVAGLETGQGTGKGGHKWLHGTIEGTKNFPNRDGLP